MGPFNAGPPMRIYPIEAVKLADLRSGLCLEGETPGAQVLATHRVDKTGLVSALCDEIGFGLQCFEEVAPIHRLGKVLVGDDRLDVFFIEVGLCHDADEFGLLTDGSAL